MFGKIVETLRTAKAKAQSYLAIILTVGMSGLALAMLSYVVGILNSSITNGNASFYNLILTVQNTFTTVGGFLVVVAVLGLLAMFFGIFGSIGGGGRRGR